VDKALLASFQRFDGSLHFYRKPVNTAHTKVGDSDELTAEEQNELRKCEKAIELAEKNTAIVAMALLSVRDGYLYRVHYLTFEIYCRQRWKRGSTYAYDLIRFATILREFSAIADIKILPEYEGQTRPLGIPDNVQAWAVPRAVSS
jgi:hypothetical protein